MGVTNDVNFLLRTNDCTEKKLLHKVMSTRIVLGLVNFTVIFSFVVRATAFHLDHQGF